MQDTPELMAAKQLIIAKLLTAGSCQRKGIFLKQLLRVGESIILKSFR